jgi:glycosidase
MTFNFHHLKVDYPGGEKWTLARPDYVALKALFRHWQQGMHNRAWNALFWCNHDQPRIVSRFGDEGEYRVPAAKMLAMVLHGMQGTPYIYQGEEIGMTNPHFSSISDYRDVESHNMFIERAAQGKAGRTAGDPRQQVARQQPHADAVARRRERPSATVSRGSALAITGRSTSRRRWRTPIRCFMPISS